MKTINFKALVECKDFYVGLSLKGEVYVLDTLTKQTPKWSEDNKKFSKILNLDEGIVQISAGLAHILALGESGKVYAWGNNEMGQVGTGDYLSVNHTVLVSGITEKVIGISAGEYSSLVVTENGLVYAWGTKIAANSMKTGIKDEVVLFPKKIEPLKEIISVGAGISHSLALDKSGRVWSWGGNLTGQLGNGKFYPMNIPEEVTGIEDKVIKIACGSLHNLALTKNGEVFSWGGNLYAQVGGRQVDDVNWPIKISRIESGVTDIAAGSYHSLALKKKEVYGWGDGGRGQFGAPKYRKTHFPTIIKHLLREIKYLPFAQGGRSVGYRDLEEIYREQLGNLITL